MSKKIPTIKDVAAHAGVGMMTVSRVCNPKTNGTVSDAMRQRVLQAINDLGYQPDVLARSLRQRRVDTIGFYNGYRDIFSLTDAFARALFIGLQDASTELKQDLLIFHPSKTPQSPADIVRELNTSKVDGVIFLPGDEDVILSQLLKASHQNIVTIGEVLPGLPAITSQDEIGSRMIAEHLHERGHRHVLYRHRRDPLPSAIRRYHGFCATAKELALQVTTTQTTLLNDEVDAKEQDLIRNAHRLGVTAIVGWHDFSAMAALLFCRHIGFNIPSDIAIAGFDALPLSACPSDVSLTTIDADWSGIARRAVAFVAQGQSAALSDTRDTVIDHDGQEEIRVAGRLRIGNTA
ncbi:MAG: LacI family DNA-binding transcriptional regulator [Capsulimonas sp.]|uniref:LacI family DNA-binding transcriptional regulator n=1 Tax=Capsulimonas sp. TaxID=2494211 RepID=UPI0032631782